jgi:hypothetical protein
MKKLKNYPATELKNELRRRGYCLIVWRLQDVFVKFTEMQEHGEFIGENLTELDAKSILQHLEACHNCNYGITWEHLEEAIRWHFEKKEATK